MLSRTSFLVRDESGEMLPTALWSLNRRAFVLSGLALAGLPWRAQASSLVVKRHPALKEFPFTLGVASGDPSPTGVVLWTRLAPDPLNGGGMPNENIEVRWVIAHDEALKDIVQEGRAIATPLFAHSLHVEVDGLEPDRWYWYGFFVDGDASPVGRTRTMPGRNVLPAKLDYAFASCQHFETGLFTAYEHMAKEQLDLVAHLGDYIYEGPGREKQVRKHVGAKLTSLEDYRNRHAQYKSDPFLQSAHAHCPWLVAWDDHEFENNYANDISERSGVDPVLFLQQRAQSYRAYYEHMPVGPMSIPQGPYMRLYKSVTFGRLAQFNVLDTRQYRTDQPCDDGNKPPCHETFDPQATLLGDEQEHWLNNSLLQSPARWNVLAQQVMMARVDRKIGPEVTHSMDQWGGYDVARKRLLSFMSERKIANPIVITGDIHSNWVNDLKVDFDRPEDPTVATEFVGTSISSGGNGVKDRPEIAAAQAENPFVKFLNFERGYVKCSVTPEQYQSDYRVVEFVDKPGAPLVTRASFLVENGQPGAKPV